MDPGNILRVVARFLDKDFGVEEALGLLGSVEDDTYPNALLLKPRHPAVQRATLGTIEIRGTQFLSNMFIELRDSIEIDFDPLIKAYGPMREGFRESEEQPVRYVLETSGRDLSGYLMLGMESSDDSTEKLKVMQFVRHPRNYSSPGNGAGNRG